MPSFSDPSIESLFVALTAVKKRHTEYTNNPSKPPAQYKAIETDLADVRQSLVKLFEKAEKTEIFKIEFAKLERFISTAWEDFDDGERPCSGDSFGWMQVFRWSGTYTAWTVLLFLVGLARSWILGDRAAPVEGNYWTGRRASIAGRGLCR